jgi:hypothetical protein
MTSDNLRAVIAQLAPLLTESQRLKVARFAAAVYHAPVDDGEADGRERERSIEVSKLAHMPIEAARQERCL